MLAIRLTEQLEKRLAKLAERTGRSKTYYAREAIEQHLEELEDVYLAERRLAKPGKLWTQDELEQDLDLDS